MSTMSSAMPLVLPLPGHYIVAATVVPALELCCDGALEVWRPRVHGRLRSLSQWSSEALVVCRVPSQQMSCIVASTETDLCRKDRVRGTPLTRVLMPSVDHRLCRDHLALHDDPLQLA